VEALAKKNGGTVTFGKKKNMKNVIQSFLDEMERQGFPRHKRGAKSKDYVVLTFKGVSTNFMDDMYRLRKTDAGSFLKNAVHKVNPYDKYDENGVDPNGEPIIVSCSKSEKKEFAKAVSAKMEQHVEAVSELETTTRVEYSGTAPTQTRKMIKNMVSKTNKVIAALFTKMNMQDGTSAQVAMARAFAKQFNGLYKADGEWKSLEERKEAAKEAVTNPNNKGPEGPEGLLAAVKNVFIQRDKLPPNSPPELKFMGGKYYFTRKRKRDEEEEEEAPNKKHKSSSSPSDKRKRDEEEEEEAPNKKHKSSSSSSSAEQECCCHDMNGGCTLQSGKCSNPALPEDTCYDLALISRPVCEDCYNNCCD